MNKSVERQLCEEYMVRNYTIMSTSAVLKIIELWGSLSNLKEGYFIILKVYWTVDEQLPVCEMLLLERIAMNNHAKQYG